MSLQQVYKKKNKINLVHKFKINKHFKTSINSLIIPVGDC